MADPNLLNITTVKGKSTGTTPSNTSATVLLANGASSGKSLKINMIVASSSASATVTATVAHNTAAAGSGTSTPLITAGEIPAAASLIVSDKQTSFYLEEDTSIVVTSGSADDVSFLVSYEEIS